MLTVGRVDRGRQRYVMEPTVFVGIDVSNAREIRDFVAQLRRAPRSRSRFARPLPLQVPGFDKGSLASPGARACKNPMTARIQEKPHPIGEWELFQGFTSPARATRCKP